MRKVLWLDTETTGLDPQENGIVQIAALIEIDGIVVEWLDAKMRPMNNDKIDQAALDVNGYTEEQVKHFPSPKEAMDGLRVAMARHVDKFDKADKFVMAGYFVRFDMDMLRGLFSKLGDKYFGSWFYSVSYDVQSLVAERVSRGFRAKNYKLKTVCKEFGISIDAHEALSDIMATRNLKLLLTDQP